MVDEFIFDSNGRRACGKVPMVKHEMASVLSVGWNANHERALGLLDSMIVHVDKRSI